MDLRRLTPADVVAYRAFMLEAYAVASDAFTATAAERAPLPVAWWAQRLSDRPDAGDQVIGAFVDGRLVGTAGLRFARRERTRHKALLFGLAVDPAVRGRGVGRALVEAVLEAARSAPDTRLVQLTVAASNTAARGLYAACGFEVFGTEPFALRIGGRFESTVHMWRAVDSVPDP